jgi:hypothetical protein
MDGENHRFPLFQPSRYRPGASMTINGIDTTQEMRICGIISVIHGSAEPNSKDPTNFAKECLGSLMDLISPTAKNEWCLAFRLLGELHLGSKRFDIVLAVLMILREQYPDPIDLGNNEDLIHTWMTSLPYARIHPASLAMCTSRVFKEYQVVLTDLFQRLGTDLFVQPINLPGNTGSSWSVFVRDGLPQDDLLGIGIVFCYGKHASSIRELCRGWITGGALGLLDFQNLVCIGPELEVIGELELRDCAKFRQALPPVRVMSKVRVNVPHSTSHKSGWAQIQSNLGYQFEDTSCYERNGSLHRRKKACGKELEIPSSLGELMGLGR